ncbi:hypothetical protein ACLOJK_029871 [Asimina triloba]
MRAVGRLATTSVGATTTAKQALLVSSSSFCSSSGGGRGRGISSPFSSPAPGKSGPVGDKYDASAEADRASAPPGLGRGRGRGKPLPPPPLGNVVSPWMPSPPPSAGRGRPQTSPSPLTPPSPDSAPKGAVFFRRFDDADSDSAPNTRGAGRGQTVRLPPPPPPRTPVVFHRKNAESKPAQSTDSVQTPRVGVFPQSILKGMHGAGRGKTEKPPETDTRAREENRHIRRGGRQPGSPSAPRLSSEGRGGRGVSRFEEGGRERGEGGRGRDREKRPRGRRERRRRRPDDEAQEEDPGLQLGFERFDENRLREKLGEKNVSRLKEVVEEVCERVFPSEEYDGYLDALDTNFLIEFEPEYAMEEFGTNPDIDDTPPIPLRDALEKMKPFLMAYEGIQSQEEWEQIMEETMAKVPYFKQLIDMYAGPDRMTAKQEQEELEKVALTIPEDAPSSVKRFTNRALLTLQFLQGYMVDLDDENLEQAETDGTWRLGLMKCRWDMAIGIDEMQSGQVSTFELHLRMDGILTSKLLIWFHYILARTQKEEAGEIITTIAPGIATKSNPGWGFDKKYQFMDKLVREVTQPMKW